MQKAAAADDVSTLASLAKEIWEEHYSPIIGAAQVSYMLERFQSEEAIRKDMLSGCVYYLARYDGFACGYGAAKKDGSGVFLSKLYVKQGYRGRGIARAILNQVYGFAKKNGAERIRLTCNKYNTSSLEIYKKLGFSITDTCFKDLGNGFAMDDYVLEKKLK